MTTSPTDVVRRGGDTRRAGFTAADGLATLGPDAVALRAALEELFLGWAAERQADPVLYPPLMRVADLDRIDYFTKFPQLGLLAGGLTEAAIARHGKGDAETGRRNQVPATDLADAGYAVPSAACYNVYLELSGQTLTETRTVTTVATCARRETHYEQLRRLLCFSMREIVCVGERDAVLAHVKYYQDKLADMFGTLGLPVEKEAATDPFFDPQGALAVAQKLFPVKEEFRYAGSLAIASVNFHRNFFGERCDIRTSSGDPVFTSCVAFGIERWLSALADHFAGDLAAARDAVRSSAEVG
jgi:seryl-tRNA synthetase